MKEDGLFCSSSGRSLGTHHIWFAGLSVVANLLWSFCNGHARHSGHGTRPKIAMTSAGYCRLRGKSSTPTPVPLSWMRLMPTWKEKARGDGGNGIDQQGHRRARGTPPEGHPCATLFNAAKKRDVEESRSGVVALREGVHRFRPHFLLGPVEYLHSPILSSRHFLALLGGAEPDIDWVLHTV